ncbi:MAG TPA: TIM barrel protein [Phycisphaerae bacterium]|nr:TIM barrel protein [Phycisphaerae bacterium]
MAESDGQRVSRRDVLAAAGGAAMAAAAGASMSEAAEKAAGDLSYTPKGNIRQSASKWCYKMPLDQLCAEGKKMGLLAIDLLGPGGDFDVLKKHGLACSMVTSSGINPGLNRKENHEQCLAKIRSSIEAASEAGFPNVICMSGNRQAGLTDEEGLENCAIALKQVVGLAEQKKVLLCMELLNSKRNHKGYMCDRTSWGVALCKKVGSESLKLLYDIYHMQIDEGDIIATIKENAQYIGHYHTGGVPGRNEIDETQELYYPAIMRAIVATGYKGFVAHEFVPKRDPLTSLAQAIRICDV